MIVLKSFYLNNKDGYDIECKMTKPIQLDNTYREYYLQLNQISFVNCVANVTSDLFIPRSMWRINGQTIEPSVIVEANSLLSLDEIYTALNNYIISQVGSDTISFQLDSINGKCKVVFGSNLESVDINTARSLLVTSFFGFDSIRINDTSISYSSTNPINVSEDNQFALYCNICNNNSYINIDDLVKETTIIWTDNLISDRFGTISLKATIPMYFKLNNCLLQDFNFSIRKLDGSRFSLVSNVSTDFFVSFNIVTTLK